MPVIQTGSYEAVGIQTQCLFNAGVPASAVWPAANLAIYIPLALTMPFLLRRLWWINGSVQNGTVDMGIYTPDGVKIVSTGATTQSGSSTVQSVDTTDILLSPGSYLMALLSSSGTARMFSQAVLAAALNHMGVYNEAVGGGTLPATATFATASNAYLPLCGIASLDTL